MVVTHQMSVLLTDVEGSTRLWETNPEEMAAALADHDRILREVIAAHSGRVFGTAGDSFAAAFPTVADAIGAAVGVQRQVQALSVGDLPLRLRMGIHYGEIEPRGDDYFGPVMNRTGRVRDTAHGGQIVLTKTAYDQLDNQLLDLTFEDLGEHRLRDLSAPIRLFRASASGLPSDFPPIKSLGAFIHNLPTQFTSFVGRSEELNAIDKLLADTRHATLLGAGGSGKTRLAIQYAADTIHHYDDGAWFVDLRDLANPGEVGSHVASTLRVATGGDRPITDQLVDALWHRNLLLILDNCEHLLDAVSSVVNQLLQRQGTIRMLATTREPLNLPGESLLPINPLPIPASAEPGNLHHCEAARLFTDRALHTKPDFTLDDHARAVFDICQACDGLPLALELAAARLRTLTPEELARRLNDQLTILKTRSRIGDPRHATIEATIEWSWNLLTEHEQTLLARLTIFQGTWALETAEAICGYEPITPTQILDLHASLIDKSLITTADVDHTTRYRLLVPIRQYATRQLGDEENCTLRIRTIDHWIGQFAGSEQSMHIGGQVMDRMYREARKLEPDHANLTAAIEWALNLGRYKSALLILAGPFGDLLHLKGAAFDEVSQWVNRALEERDAISDDVLVAALWIIAPIAAYSMHNEEQLRYTRLGMDLARNRTEYEGFAVSAAIATDRLGQHDSATAMFEKIVDESDDPSMQASALIGQALGHTRPFEAWELMRRAMDLSPLDSLGFWDESNAMMAAGVLAREAGLYERATELLERCIEVAREREDQGTFALGAVYLAGTYTLTGRLDEAGEVIDEAVPAVRRLLGPDMSTTRVFSRAANTSRLRGDFESALGYLAEARRAAERNDESWVTQSAAVQEALIARDRGDLDGAQRLLDDIEHQPGADYGALILQLLRFNQVGLALRRGDHVEAHQKLRDVLSDPELFTHYDTVEAVALSAVALSQVGRFDVAVRLLAAADRERERTGLVVQSPDRPILEEAVQQTRSGLGDSWESVYTEGRSISLDRAVSLARELAARHSQGS